MSTDRIITRFQRQGDTVVASAEDGDEVVRMPLQVPTVERPEFDPDVVVYRHNIT